MAGQPVVRKRPARSKVLTIRLSPDEHKRLLKQVRPQELLAECIRRILVPTHHA